MGSYVSNERLFIKVRLISTASLDGNHIGQRLEFKTSSLAETLFMLVYKLECVKNGVILTVDDTFQFNVDLYRYKGFNYVPAVEIDKQFDAFYNKL